ncbi:MAG: flagellar biosynthesis protein FlhB [Oscillospiraceae bacterium]|nr:flagellar biosynthesis protein FlhB [Oscillospiraceae bacterium]
MADNGDKTEPATAKRRRDVRKEGRVAKSQDLSAGITLLAMFGALKGLGGYIARNLQNIVTRYLTLFSDLAREPFEVNYVHLKMIEVCIYAALIIAPIVFTALLVGVGVQYAQVGILKKEMKFRLDSLNFIKGLKNLFNMRAFVELLKSSLKFIIMGYILYREIRKRMSYFPSFVELDYRAGIQFMIDMIFSVGFKLGGFMLGLGILDYIYQKWSFEKSIRMSKQEIKDEYKQQEGDPKIKSKIRQKQQQIAMQRMMAALPGADVVITNPTHYAVALKYDDEGSGAPVVVAKGKDFVARKIKEKAREYRIETVENRPLAQALYKTVPVGVQIPPEFYRAVAEILAQIYKKRRKRIRR